MNITVTVIDGVSGHPAEGFGVTVAGRPAGEQPVRMHRLTDPRGNFTYSLRTEQLSRGARYTIELNVDPYFASLGTVPGYTQVTIVARILNTQADHHICALITPFMNAIWNVR